MSDALYGPSDDEDDEDVKPQIVEQGDRSGDEEGIGEEDEASMLDSEPEEEEDDGNRSKPWFSTHRVLPPEEFSSKSLRGEHSASPPSFGDSAMLLTLFILRAVQ